MAEFVTGKGVEFTVLELGDVNGANEHPMYTALKELSSKKDIRWNFATYFLVDKKGAVTRHDGVSPYRVFVHSYSTDTSCVCIVPHGFCHKRYCAYFWYAIVCG